MSSLSNLWAVRSIVARQTILSVFSLMLGVIGVSLAIFMFSVEQYEDNSYRSYARYLSSINNILTSNLETVGLNLKYIAQGPAVALYRKDKNVNELEKSFAQYAHQLSRMYYVNEQGDIEVSVGSKDRIDIGSSILDMKIFISQQASLYDINYGEVQPYEEEIIRFIDIFYAFIDSNGEFRGTVGGSIEVQSLPNFFTSIPRISHASLHFINPDNQIVSSNDKKLIGKRFPEMYFESYPALEPQRTQFLDCDCIITTVENKILGWRIVSSVPYEFYISPLTDIFVNGSLVVFIILFVVILVSVVASRRILVPIAKLNNFAGEIAESSDFSKRIEWQSADELGSLSNSINKMMNRLQEATSDVLEEKHYSENIIASMADSLFILNMEGKIRQVNEAAISQFGYSEQEFIGAELASFLKSEGDTIEKTSVVNFFATGTVSNFDSLFVTKSGELIPITASGSVHSDTVGKVVGSIFIIKDIADRKAIEKHLSHLANHDPLTGLPNRALLMDRLKQSFSRLPWNKRYVALLFLDLDRFKFINDTLGHHVGDELIKSVAERLLLCVREGDTVARLGGDEFILMLTDVAYKTDAVDVAKKVLESLSRPFLLARKEYTITASIGISIHPGDGEDAQTLMKNADAAMYRVKGSGKNSYVLYSESISAGIEKQLKIETALRKALENNELEMYYQPQIDIRTNDLVGVEALIRWNSQDGGVISPADFLPVAEETGLMESIGDWVIDDCLSQLAQWNSSGFRHFTLSINIAAKQFQREDFSESILARLENYAVDPGLVDLELTEGIIMENVDDAKEKIERLKSIGVLVSLDDFGTGYSSLAHLKRFNIDTIKIDRSFIDDIPGDNEGVVIVNAIIELAHSLGLRLIAEGVENKKQVNFIADKKCYVVQGYYYSKPISAAEFTKKYLDV